MILMMKIIFFCVVVFIHSYLSQIKCSVPLERRFTTCDGDVRSRVDDFQSPFSHDVHVDEKLLLLRVKLLPQRLDLAAVQGVSNGVGHQSWKGVRDKTARVVKTRSRTETKQKQVDGGRHLRSRTNPSGDRQERVARQTRTADFNESPDARRRRWFNVWLTASFHPLCSRVHSVGQGTDDAQLGE